jgi:hypothetical protein
MNKYHSVVFWEIHALPNTTMTIRALEDGGSVAGVVPTTTVLLPRDQRTKLVFTNTI